MGQTLGLLRRYEDARPVFQKAVALAPDYHHGYRELAWTHLRSGELDMARSVAASSPKELEDVAYWVAVYSGDYPAAPTVHDEFVFALEGDPITFEWDPPGYAVDRFNVYRMDSASAAARYRSLYDRGCLTFDELRST